MRIGIDIDNVIANFNECFLKEYIKHDKELRNTGIVNKNANYIRNGMFDWSIEEEQEFYDKNIERIAKNLSVIHGAKKYINKLKRKGHDIYIITGRNNGEYTDPYNMTINWLKDNNIYYDKLIFTNSKDKHEKSLKCIENNIDIMIEDSIRICTDCIESGINTVIMNTKYNKSTNILRVNNWKEFYKYVLRYEKSKKIILDTDICNECDDQFALAYLLKSKENFIIEAITLAPYFHEKKDKTIRDNQEKSYSEALKVCKMIDNNIINKIYMGSTDYISNGYDSRNDAVDKIIDVANKNTTTYILAIGALTNIALAIKKDFKIVNRIEVIWLGGNELNFKDNLEFNFRQDIEAVKVLLNSNVKLTIIPCKNVVSKLNININELKESLNNNSDLCQYLINKFHNDGYHEVQSNRVLWDVSTIAFMINNKWFKKKEISRPIINNDSTYGITNSKNKITMVTNIDKDKIFLDMCDKLKR